MAQRPHSRGSPSHGTQAARQGPRKKFGSGGGDRHSGDRRHAEPAGYPVRALAVRLVSAVIDRGRALDDALAAEFRAGPGAELEARDRGLARLIASTVLRRKSELDSVIGAFLERPLPDDRGLLSPILECAAAQLLLLDIAPHAVINIAVEQCRHDRGARRFDRLANAVLRKVSTQGREVLAGSPGIGINVPDWLWDGWVRSYGPETAGLIAEASLKEAPLDVSVRNESEIEAWTEKLGGKRLPTDSVRIVEPETRVDLLPGFAEGAWWVQDAAAALPARLLGEVRDRTVADLCAAPGGKTVQLAVRGAQVTAVDVSAERLARVRENLDRLKLAADIVTADVTAWQSGRTFDAVLLDAPCTATGTIRRHPDILYLKRPDDLGPLVELQARMLDHAAALVSPGGMLVYCTCSLEPEEGEGQVEQFLARSQQFERAPLTPGEMGLDGRWITARGELRTLPHLSPGGEHGVGGMDGFFAARLVHRRQ